MSELNVRDPRPVEFLPATGSVLSCERESASGPAGPILVLHVAGEIDMVSLPEFHDALDAALDQRPADLVVDLTAVGFCCVRSFALLAATADTARTNGTGYAVSGLSPLLSRIATLLWPEHPPVRHPSVAAAVAAIRARPGC